MTMEKIQIAGPKVNIEKSSCILYNSKVLLRIKPPHGRQKS